LSFNENLIFTQSVWSLNFTQTLFLLFRKEFQNNNKQRMILILVNDGSFVHHYSIFVDDSFKISISHASLIYCLTCWGQFHQCSTSSFYVHRSPKRKKDSQVESLFLALLGSVCVKSAHRMLMKLTLGVNFANILLAHFSYKSSLKAKM